MASKVKALKERKRDKRFRAQQRKRFVPGGAGRELMLDWEVDLVVPLSRSTRWRLRKLDPPQFPEPLRLGRKRVAYRAAEIAAFIAGTWRPPAPQPAAA
jgi:predicted DNA-binding transcriptional regulator AlpA